MAAFQHAAIALLLTLTACDSKSTPAAGGASSATTATATGAGAVAGKSVDAALTKAGIAFTAKDKTPFAKSLLAAAAAELVSYTEYNFTDSSLILLVAEFSNVQNVLKLGATLGDSIKPQAAQLSLEYASVGGMKDKHLSAFTLNKADDARAAMKVLGAISE